MEDFTFDINDILTAEEAEQLFNNEEQQVEEPAQPADTGATETETEEKPAEVPSEPERVGVEDNNNGNDAVQEGDGSSPDMFYSSIADALRKDGIFPDFDDKTIQSVKTPEDFGELIEKAIEEKLDERVKRVDSALRAGMQPTEVQQYEQTLGFLNSVTDENLKDESEEGENLRKALLFRDLTLRGYTQERAVKEVEKSFRAGTDLEDAQDALDALKQFYSNSYKNHVESGKQQRQQQQAAIEASRNELKKMIVDTDIEFGGEVIDKRTRQKIYDAVTKPVYKDPKTGQLLTQLQKFSRENANEFMKMMGMWYVLTDGGKDTKKVAAKAVQKERNKGIRELASKINSTSFNPDGSLNYPSGGDFKANDPLLSDDWKII